MAWNFDHPQIQVKEKPMKTALFALLLSSIPVLLGTGAPPAALPAVDNIPIDEPEFFVLETLTIYNPTEGQCDSSPLITASNAQIDIEKLRRQEIRWMALSRNLLTKWNGKFQYGDTVMLKAGDPTIDGLWVINDNMNKRFKDRGDLLFHSDTRKGGLWKNVKVAKLDRKTEVAI
jgi:hypothetical protein